MLNEFSKYNDFFHSIGEVAELPVLRNYFTKIIVNLGIKCIENSQKIWEDAHDASGKSNFP